MDLVTGIISGGAFLFGPGDLGESGEFLASDGAGNLLFTAIDLTISGIAGLQAALDGKAPASTVSAVSPLTLTAANAAHVPLTVKGAASQTGNLAEWQNNAAGVVAAISPAGIVTTTQVSSPGTLTLSATSQNSDHIEFAIGGISNSPCFIRPIRAHADVPTNGAALSTATIGGSVIICGRSRSTGSGANGDVAVAAGNCASAGNLTQAGTLTLRGGTHSNTALHGDIDLYWGGALVMAIDANGIHVGDAPTRKLGFFGAAPVARPATPANLGEVIAALQALGLVS